MTPTVIIIGGGVAGLKAAQVLASQNIKVTLLEARNRLGGRIYTVQTADQKSLIELGASYWEGLDTIPFFQRYLKSRTIHLEPQQSKFISLDSKSDTEALLTYYNLANELIDRAETEYAGRSFAEFLQNQKPSYWLSRFLENGLLHHCTPLEFGGFPSFSRLPVPENEQWNTKDADFTFVKGGYNQVINQLEHECCNLGVEIILNRPVQKIIDQGAQGVIIETPNAKYHGQKVLSTIPIGVLKKQAQQLFSPSLSQNKLQALATIGIHDATRVVLEFPDKPFWDNPNGPYLYLDSQQSRCLLEFRNAYPLTGKAILVTGKYSDIARVLYQQHPHDFNRAEQLLVDKILTDLRKAFPHINVPPPIHATVYCWTHDPFAQGAYPYRKENMDESMQQALEQREGNIYFAGADFSRYGFSVHNAYANAENVAARLYENLMN